MTPFPKNNKFILASQLTVEILMGIGSDFVLDNNLNQRWKNSHKYRKRI